ncbi:MAG: alanine racemase [Myxococcota bacterium]|nr:alanine racemase [Myxococcota bacterium]
MKPLPLGELLHALSPRFPSEVASDAIIQSIRIDSRRCGIGDLFFALSGTQTDGHRFVQQALDAGASAAVVSQDPGPGRILVDDPLAALQRLASWYRRHHLGTVLAITGSNGKTIVKDALAGILAGHPGLYISPGSHNSQLGVPLSVLAAPGGTALGVFEAGVSAPGEMARLARILSPECGLLTNIGLAHIAGFGSRSVTASEKLTLFTQDTLSWLILPPDEPLLDAHRSRLSGRLLEYGRAPLPRVVQQQDRPDGAFITVEFPDGSQHGVNIGVRAPPLIADLEAAMGAAWQLRGEGMVSLTAADIIARIEGFSPGPTRMEVWRAPDGVTIINDAHSSDPISVQAALRAARGSGRRIFVFGGMRELGSRSASEHALVGQIAAEQGFSHLILLPEDDLKHTAGAFLDASNGGSVAWADSADDIRAAVHAEARSGDVVLVKGPRGEGLVRTARAIWESMAPRRLIVDLGAIGENIDCFRQMVGPSVKILAMLKAWAYGTELARVAVDLQRRGVDWIGVAAADEGAMARRAGVHLPILVTLLDVSEIDKVIRYRLTPALYSMPLAEALIEAAQRADVVIDVHLQVDTGMGRLGMQTEEIGVLARRVMASGVLRPTGLMTHFSSADNPDADPYSTEQLDRFEAASAELAALGLTDLLEHTAASAAAVRFPRARRGMIRIGLALYGVHPSPAPDAALPLRPAIALLGRVAHTLVLRRGQKVGYSGTYTVTDEHRRLGIVGMGYNDGIPWRLSGRGHALINGKKAPFIGRVSMDSLAVDLTDLPDVDVGAEVLFFGSHEGHTLSPEDVAELAGTIPYELLVRVDSRRVQRLFVGD